MTEKSASRTMGPLVCEWPSDPDDDYAEECGDDAASEFNIAQAMAREIMYVNDECLSSNGPDR